jgi:molybdopterin-guanine dinucleotide biosynthesis protein A
MMESGLPPVFHSRATPIFSICGLSESERAAFLISLAQALADHGLKTVIVRRDPLDPRIYELVVDTGMPDLACDLILVDGLGTASIPGIRLVEGQSPSPEEGPILPSFGPERRVESVLAFLVDRLAEIWRQTPVWACVLIGGCSTRMGRPKHLLTDNEGVTWLNRTVGLLQPLVDGIVLSGKGVIPEELDNLIRLPDIPGLVGPLAGILSAMRWHPAASWLLVACDMPDIMKEALTWLLARRQPGIWGTLPRMRKDGPVEPLLAHYDFRCRQLFEDLAGRGCLRIGAVAENPKIETPPVPKQLLPSWRNVNSPADL